MRRLAIGMTFLFATSARAQATSDLRDSLQALVQMYDRAIQANPDDMNARVKLAELFLDKYNSGEAKKTLAGALARNSSYVPALVLEARRRDFDNEGGADSLLSRALTLENGNVAAHVLRGRFRADVEDFAGARQEAEAALKTDPRDPDALALGFALAVVTGDSADKRSLGARFTQAYPRDARAHVAAAELLARVRQYRMAADWARQATTIDSSSSQAHNVLGMNLLRVGDIADAQTHLEIAFRSDPYNVWTKNTLDLLDTFGEYDEITHGPFRFMIEKTESPIINLYLGDIADRAYATFAKRYGFTPTGTIRVEVYRSHADFSVRTVGLAGLGALGVSFGNTVAFDSPAAKDAGPFNWGSTAWHEIAHTFTLGSSDMRVPRWLSEGLSVYEERRGHPGWGQNVSPAFIQAYAQHKLRPLFRLNDGFVRPSFPQEVGMSYYAASLVCDMIARDFGEPALAAFVQAFRDGSNADQAARRVLKTDLVALDKRFDAYVRQRFASAFANMTEYRQQLVLGSRLLENGNTTEAIAALENARKLIPEFGGAESPYVYLAQAYIAQNDLYKAADALATLTSLGDVPYEMHVKLADLRLQLGDTAKAADALESAMYMNPFEIAQHERLATMYTALRQRDKAVRERRAVVALGPVDRAEAYYRLAVAYREAGDMKGARHSVLRSLEVAPNFERAQTLLLALHENDAVKKP